MTRRPGSGLANVTTRAIEEMWAASLLLDQDEFNRARRELETQRERGRCGVDVQKLVVCIGRAVRSLGLNVLSAIPHFLDGLGDVRCQLRSGEYMWFEIKAQTTKPRFSDITQADWVRDDTDFVKHLAASHKTIHTTLPPWAAEQLHVANPTQYFGSWTSSQLWAADMCLLSSRTKREVAGVQTASDLMSFARRKILVQIAQPGIRLIRFYEIAPIAAALSGAPVDMKMTKANHSAISIAIASPGRIGRGATNFTYHIAYPSMVLGRHKMHAVSLDTPTKYKEYSL